MDQPTLSIIVLTYNRKRELGDCLRSLLAQTYPHEHLEILVSDDGSSDGTREMVTALQARHAHLEYVPQPHRGIPAARNNGIRHARGDLIAIVADDYILPATYAATIVEFFRGDPAAMVVRFKIVAAGRDAGSRISHFYFDVSIRRRLAPQPAELAHGWRERLARAWHRTLRVEETITAQHALEAAGAAAFRREVFARVGLFDESLQRAEDTDMTARLRALGIPIHYYPFQQIRHQYDPLMRDTLAKCFRTGVNRYRLYRKQARSLREGRGMVAALITYKTQAVLDALWRARQAESVPTFLLYLPFMFLFEAVNKLGFLCGLIAGRLGERTSVAARRHSTSGGSSA